MPLPTSDAFEQFSSTLHSSGLREALRFLLEQTDYRFIGIFRFKDGMARAVVHYDREHPEQLTTEAVPDTATYCCYVRDSSGSFTTVDALEDARTADHPARESIRAYCGVPVITPEGELLGTLCHYDEAPRDPSQIDFELMLQVCALLARSGTVPAY
jgi:GAF domain-containing protein